jgi:argininosuccinate lyase
MRKGRLRRPAAQLAQRYSESISFDCRLYRHDVAGSIAHSAALARAGIITAEEAANRKRIARDRSDGRGADRSWRDKIQEDKKALFDSVDTIERALEIFGAMLPELKINRGRMENAARDPYLRR